MTIDAYLNRTYNRKTYNCAHLVCEVWKDLTGDDISVALRGFLNGRGEGRAVLSDLRKFKRLTAPQSPCIVLFHANRQAPHVGIFLRGRVLHIQPRGVEFQPLDVVSLGFKRIGFYLC